MLRWLGGNNLLEKFVLDYLPVAKDGFLQIRRGKCFPYTRLHVTVKKDLKRKKDLERLHQRVMMAESGWEFFISI